MTDPNTTAAAPFETISSNKKRSTYRCGDCYSGRLDGKPCVPAKCICRCHLRTPAGAIPPVLGGWKVPRSFDQEVSDGVFGPVGPRRLK